MKKFELWLDESGDFENDAEKTGKGKTPSLVGGLLIESNSFPDSYINAVLPESGTYHSVNENDQLERFKKINELLYKNEFNRIVVFSNQERIMILDNNLTYLNVITEGVFQLIKHLKAQYGDVFLRVIAANRVNTTTGENYSQSLVPPEEYVKRLKEKMLMESLEKSISEKEWTLETASARKDKRLMLADIICNTYFTRRRNKKFDAEERDYIRSLYSDERKTLIFTVFESILEKEFKNNLIENRIGEAVSNICLSNDEEALERCFSLLKLNFASCGAHDINFQYKFVESYIEYYINVVRDFDLCVNFLENLLKYYIPLLKEYDKTGSLAGKLSLDIKFYMLTVYTHKGNLVMSDQLTDECDRLINDLPFSLDTINYRIKFETRKISNLINAFSFEDALVSADSQVKKCEEIKDMMGLVSDDRSYYDELAKALGTRVQIKAFLLRQNATLYDSAREDSDNAIEEFVSENDKRRQFLYRVQLETEHKDFDTALKYLKMAVDAPEESDEKALWTLVEQDSPFAVNAYIRLMAESTSSQWEKSEKMFIVLSNSDYIKDLYSQKEERLYHPQEIILWKYGYYCAQNNMVSAAIKYYEKASEICFTSTADLTLNLIGLGIELEEHGILLRNRKKEATAHSKNMQKKWASVQAADEKGILEKLFGKVDFNSNEPQYYMDLGRKITY